MQALPPQLEQVSALPQQQAVGEEKQLGLMPSGELMKDCNHPAALQQQPQQQELRRRSAHQQQEAGHPGTAIQLATAGDSAIGRMSTDAPLLEVARAAVAEDDSPKDSPKVGSSTGSGVSMGPFASNIANLNVSGAERSAALGGGGAPAVAVSGSLAAADKGVPGPAGGEQPAQQQR